MGSSSAPRYAELHAHSAFSFLDGASHPEELVAEAARLGLAAHAVTDHDGLYGVVRFAEAARAVELAARRDETRGRDEGAGGRPARERTSHRTLAAAREHEPLPGRLLGELLQAVARGALGPGREVRRRDRARQRAVAIGSAREDEQMRGSRVRHACREIEHVGTGPHRPASRGGA